MERQGQKTSENSEGGTESIWRWGGTDKGHAGLGREGQTAFGTGYPTTTRWLLRSAQQPLIRPSRGPMSHQSAPQGNKSLGIDVWYYTHTILYYTTTPPHCPTKTQCTGAHPKPYLPHTRRRQAPQQQALAGWWLQCGQELHVHIGLQGHITQRLSAFLCPSATGHGAAVPREQDTST